MLVLPLLLVGSGLAWLKSRRPRTIVTLPNQSIHWVAWMPDGKRLAVLSLDFGAKYYGAYPPQPLTLWQIDEAKQLWRKEGTKIPCALLSNGRILTNGVAVQLFNDKGNLLHQWRGDKEALDAWGDTLVRRGRSGLTLEFNTLNLRTRSIVLDKVSPCNVAQFSPDGRLLASNGKTNFNPLRYNANSKDILNLWDVKTGKVLRRIASIDSEWPYFGFSPDSKRLATCSSGTLMVWDCATGRKLWQTSPSTLGGEVHFSPDGRLVAAQSAASDLALYDAHTGTLQPTLHVQSDDYAPSPPHGISPKDRSLVNTFAFSPDSKTVAIGVRGGTVTLWNAG